MWSSKLSIVCSVTLRKSDTPRLKRTGGSWFIEGACLMTSTSHKVEVPFPQAFAPLASSPFPCAPRYGRPSPLQADRPPTVRWECALRRDSTLSIRPRCTCTRCYARAFTHGNDVPWNESRNTLDLSHVQTLYRPILAQGEKSGNPRIPLSIFIHPRSQETGRISKRIL
jgi:hypothetical protein